jgi:hypothetical protein
VDSRFSFFHQAAVFHRQQAHDSPFTEGKGPQSSLTTPPITTILFTET